MYRSTWKEKSALLHFFKFCIDLITYRGLTRSAMAPIGRASAGLRRVAFEIGASASAADVAMKTFRAPPAPRRSAEDHTFRRLVRCHGLDQQEDFFGFIFPRQNRLKHGALLPFAEVDRPSSVGPPVTTSCVSLERGRSP